MNKELNNMIKKITKTPIKPLGRLNYAFVRINVLLDYIKIINNNPKQVSTPANKQAIKTGQEPAMQLYDYLILEICSFYDLIKNVLKKEHPKLDFPPFPAYLNKIYKFRNAIPGHLDKKSNLTKGKDWIEAYNIFTEVGIEKILLDFHKYYKTCVKRFGSEWI